MAEGGSPKGKGGAGRGRRLLLRQPMMNRVLYALAPVVVAAIYYFGWRAAAMLAVSAATGLVVEGAFTLRRGEPISLAILVTAVIYTLILPITVPFGVVAVGMAFATVFGKMVFGGWARNVFNPAMVGRCFVYVCFPNTVTGKVFGMPAEALPGGFGRWMPAVDAITSATPIAAHHFPGGDQLSWTAALLGQKAGSIGETAGLLIILCGLYLIVTRTARWEGVVACLAGLSLMDGVLKLAGVPDVPYPGQGLFIGGYLFGAFFMITDPISSARTRAGRYIFGAGAGVLAVLIRTFSIWTAGFMFALLLMNAFNPIVDVAVNGLKARRKTPKAAKA